MIKKKEEVPSVPREEEEEAGSGKHGPCPFPLRY
jgi:hypothetical protein